MNRFKKILIYSSLFAVSAFIALFIVTSLSIGNSVEKNCQMAQDKYPDNCTQALISYLQDKDNSYRSRNSAIWALGQLGDPQATKVLQSYYTGTVPPRESLDQDLSQLELKKAIKLTKGGINLTRPIWKNL